MCFFNGIPWNRRSDGTGWTWSWSLVSLDALMCAERILRRAKVPSLILIILVQDLGILFKYVLYYILSSILLRSRPAYLGFYVFHHVYLRCRSVYVYIQVYIIKATSGENQTHQSYESYHRAFATGATLQNIYIQEHPLGTRSPKISLDIPMNILSCNALMLKRNGIL